jgi:hypothetical protein
MGFFSLVGVMASYLTRNSHLRAWAPNCQFGGARLERLAKTTA